MPSKDAYTRILHARLDEWQAEIDRMTAHAERANAEARLAIEREIDELRERRAEAEARLGDLREAGEEAWQDMLAGTKRAFGDLSDAVKRAADRF